MDIAFVKGHGTENDFVLLPDAAGRLDLTPERVAAICDRRRGLGADGVIRVVRTDATDDPDAVSVRGEARWFMDYRNADGSLSQMCGNGIRVLGRYLATHADVDPRDPLLIGTRGGLRLLRFGGGVISVDMGIAQPIESSEVSVGERTWTATGVSLGNPHAVVFVDDLADAGDLREPPSYDAGRYPEGANVEFVHRTGERRLGMRVFERGSGETRSCGTGACAAAFAAHTAVEGGAGVEGGPRPGDPEAGSSVEYTVDLAGGTLRVAISPEGSVELTGPAELIAEGVLTL